MRTGEISGSNVEVSGELSCTTGPHTSWTGAGHDATHRRSQCKQRSADLWWWSTTVTSAQSHDSCQGRTELNISRWPNISTDYRDFTTSNSVNFMSSDTFFYFNWVDKVILEQIISIRQQQSHVRRKNCLFRHLNETCQKSLMLFYTIFKILYTQMSSENNFYFYNQFYCNVP